MAYFNLVDYSEKNSIYFTIPKTWVMWALIDLHDYLMFFLINISVLVILFLFYTLAYRYKFLHIASKDLEDYVEFKLEDINHAPSLEFFWTMVPVGLLFLMGWPSFKLLYAMEQLIDPFHTVIVIGNQWYWTYQYSDFDVTFDMIYQLDSDLFFEYKKNALESLDLKSYIVNKANIEKYINFTQFIQLVGKHFRNYEESQIIYDSVIISEENLPLGYPRLLSVDQVLVLPSNVSIRLLITSTDVIHSWALPSHGIKMDAIPGRINQVPFLCNFWGTYWGQCSELCGINHGFMPIEVRVVPFYDYMTYLNLNLATKYDLFQPIFNKFIYAYLNHLKFTAETSLYYYHHQIIFDEENKILNIKDFDFYYNKLKKLIKLGTKINSENIESQINPLTFIGGLTVESDPNDATTPGKPILPNTESSRLELTVECNHCRRSEVIYIRARCNHTNFIKGNTPMQWFELIRHMPETFEIREHIAKHRYDAPCLRCMYIGPYNFSLLTPEEKRGFGSALCFAFLLLTLCAFWNR